MKKKLQVVLAAVIMVLIVSAMNTPLSAQGLKGISLYAGGGAAFSDLEGPVLNFGIDLGFSDRFGVHPVMDYLLDPLPDLETDSVKYSVIGSNVFCAYNLTTSEKMKFFIRAGIHLSAFRAKFESSGVIVTTNDSDFGLAGGLGLKYALGGRLGLIVGGDLKVIFDSGDTVNYINAYVGLSYRFGGED